MNHDKIKRIVESLVHRVGYYGELTVPHQMELNQMIRDLEKESKTDSGRISEEVIGEEEPDIDEDGSEVKGLGPGSTLYTSVNLTRDSDSYSEIGVDSRSHLTAEIALLEVCSIIAQYIEVVKHTNDQLDVLNLLKIRNYQSALERYNMSEKVDGARDEFVISEDSLTLDSTQELRTEIEDTVDSTLVALKTIIMEKGKKA